MKQKYILLIIFSLLVFKGKAQNNYSVAPIPFQPFTGTLTTLNTADDTYSNIIPLPFSFDFYGVTYNQMIVSTNGFINFTTTSAGGVSPWSFSQQIPNASFPVTNSILGCFEDLYNNSGFGSITYGSYGTAPHRKFIVYFNNQPHYQCNTSAISSFQMILSETSNTVDVQIIDRQSCISWNGGRGVIGLVKNGSMAIAAPGRNTGSWTAHNEAWRFYRAGYYPNYSFVRCDDNADGFQEFNLLVAANDLAPSNPSGVFFYSTLADAQATINPITNLTAYTNTSNPQIIYAKENGIIKTVTLSVFDCDVDADNDGVSSSTEDVNNDTNLANDDTDFDGIPNYLDNDDDGDLVLTNIEYVFGKNVSALLDTDNDGIPNYLDNDDDGDGSLTFLEDYNHDGNPVNDDTNFNNIPDYLDQAVTLGVSQVRIDDNAILMYPNPATSMLNILNKTTENVMLIEIYNSNGSRAKSINSTQSLTTIPVSDLQSGVYFVKVIMNNQVGNYKLIKD